MSISKSLLNQVNTALHSSWCEALGQLRSLGVSSQLDWNSNKDACEFVQCIDTIINMAGEEVSIDNNTYFSLRDFIPPGKSARFAVGGSTVYEITYEDVDHSRSFYLNGVRIFDVDMSFGIVEVFKNVVTSAQLLNINTLAENMSRTQGLRIAVSEVCSAIGALTSSTFQQSVASIQNVINTYASYFGDWYQKLLRSVIQGPEAILGVLGAMFQDVYTVEQSQYDVSTLLSSSSYVVNQFAWGAVVETVGTVIQYGAIIVAAFSKIIGAIIAGIGLVVRLVARFTEVYATNYSETRFKISWSYDATHCFSWVLSQTTITDATIASWMRAYGTNCMSVLCLDTASVVLLALSDPNDNTNNQIVMEEHLSTDFDLSDFLSVQTIGDSLYDTGKKVVCYPNSVHGPVHVCFSPSNSNSFGDYMLEGNWGLFYYPDTGGAMTSLVNAARPVTDCYKPINFKLLDHISDLMYDSIQDVLSVRLCSALIININTRLLAMVRLHLDSVNTEWGRYLIKPAFGPHTFPDSDYHAIMQFYELMDLAWLCFCDSATWAGNVSLKTSFGMTTTQFDNLILTISKLYDGIQYDSHVRNDGDMEYYLYYYRTNSNGSLKRVQINSWTISMDTQCNDLCNLDFVYTWGIIPLLNSGFIPGDNLDPGWTKTFMVEMPTLTFDGFVAGLLIDVAIVVVAAAAAGMIAYGYHKLIQYRAQLEAKASVAAFNYGDGKISWSEYKAARRKYNLVALATGAPKMDISGTIQDTKTETDSQTALNTLANIASGIINANSTLTTIQSKTENIEGSATRIITLIIGEQD